MSRSEANARIQVNAPLGTTITLADGGFRTVAQTTTTLEKDFPGGVYTLTLSEGEIARQWIARLRPGQVWRYPEDVPSSELGSGSADNPLADRRRRWLADEIVKNSRREDSEIVVVVSSPDFEATAALERTIRLRSANNASVVPNCVVMLDASHTLIRYAVPTGAHRLGFESFERKRLEQSVFVLPQRTSVVLMNYGQASIVVEAKGAKRIQKRRGIDPARTTVVSYSSETTPVKLDDQLRLAGILLYLLRSRVSPADMRIAQALHDAAVDPYLKLYAAIGAIVLPGSVMQRLARSIDGSAFAGSLPAEAVARKLHSQLARWRDWADVTCLGWRLKTSSDSVVTSLPMLEVNWRWASAHSVRDRVRPVIDPSVVLAALKADSMGSPWMVVGALPSATEVAENDDVNELLPELTLIATKIAKILGASDGVAADDKPGNEKTAFLDAAWLEPKTERLVQAIVQTGGTERWSSGDAELLPQLAASLGEPLSALAKTIRSVSDDLGRILNRAAADPSNLWNSDPHKGCFGGKPTCDGAVLELATVIERDDYKSLALELTVSAKKGAKPLEGYVTFYLHPTFSPSVEKVAVVDGVANFSFHAWGAFTLGAETADGRRMELDLALELVLPEDFRNR